MGITVGAHRLWSHRSFEASFLVRLCLMLCNSIANQGSIYDWAMTHRVHHRFPETDADPHKNTALRGAGYFLAQHMGCRLVLQQHPQVIKARQEIDGSDLLDDVIVAWQERLDPWLPLYMCFVLPAQVAKWGWGEEFWVAFLVAGVLRYCLVLHCTWLINSAIHHRSLSSSSSQRDHHHNHHHHQNNYQSTASSCTAQARHKNWHHKYPFDYAASEFGISRQLNPSKLLIDVLALAGLVWGRKRSTSVWLLRGEQRIGKEGRGDCRLLLSDRD